MTGNEMEQGVKSSRLAQGYKPMPLSVAMQHLAETLPTAETRPIEAVKENILSDGQERIGTKLWRSVVVNNEIVSVVGKNYRLVQHYDAFMPILHGLEKEKIQNVLIRTDHHKAHAAMDVMLDDNVADSVRIGYRVRNSHDGKHSLSYSFSAEKVQRSIQMVEHKQEVKEGDAPRKGGYRFIELVGFRQTCSNGMKIRIPIASVDPAKANASLGKPSDHVFGEGREWIETVITEVWKEPQMIENVLQIARHYAKVVHIGKANDKVVEQEKAVQALALLRSPIQQLILRAKECKMVEEDIEVALTSRFGSRKCSQMISKLEQHEGIANAWDVYNCMTNFATHIATKVNDKNMIQDRAADFLVTLVIDTGQRKKKE